MKTQLIPNHYILTGGKSPVSAPLDAKLHAVLIAQVHACFFRVFLAEPEFMNRAFASVSKAAELMEGAESIVDYGWLGKPTFHCSAEDAPLLAYLAARAGDATLLALQFGAARIGIPQAALLSVLVWTSALFYFGKAAEFRVAKWCAEAGKEAQ